MTKILLVEDNEENRDMLSRRLTRRGYEVVIATDGGQGVAMAQSEIPDLILMDMDLPVLNGWEATRQLKAAPATRAIPIIALTAHAMVGDREKALEAGSDDYDTKPIDFARLRAKIEALLLGTDPVTPSDYAVLVVDDNEDKRYTLTQRLKRQGYTDVAIAVDGREALDSSARGGSLLTARAWRWRCREPPS